MEKQHAPLAALTAIVLATACCSQVLAQRQAVTPPVSSPTVKATPAAPTSAVRAYSADRALASQTDEAFSSAQVDAFLTAAMAAEASKDPLQRCLQYPDPPGSHWSHAAVAAYCRYRTQPYLHAAQAQALIASGHARELDRQLARALRQQQTEPDARGLLDHIYLNAFNDGSSHWRTLLDSWKRQSPHSAFAHAASGMAHVEAAFTARGGKWISETPDRNIREMDRLLALARADLRQAVRLNPHLTVAWYAQVEAARMNGGDEQAQAAATGALHADPYDYALFADRMVSAQPKWGGSMQAMRALAAQAHAGAARNPLLELLVVEPDAYAEGICGCGGGEPTEQVAYTRVLDRVAGTETLSAAGHHASDRNQFAPAIVYLSEALRFDPDLRDDRMARLYNMSSHFDSQGRRTAARPMLAAEADRIMADPPMDSMNLALIGQFYAVDLRDFDRAWTISAQMIKTHPDDFRGWSLRALIQQMGQRPGLRDTERYILAHFADDPAAQGVVRQARQDLARTPASGH